MIMLFSVGTLVIILKRRCTEHFVYLLLIFMALINIIDVFGAEVELSKIDDEEERIRSLEKWLYFAMINYFTAALFISPSLSFLVFGYGPPTFIANIYLILKYGEFENSDFLNYLANVPFHDLMTILIFYIFQQRELKRFFELKQSQGKSEQLLTVLNGQNNSIIVVQSTDNGSDEQASPHTPNVVFSNDHCLNLFGKHLVENTASQSETQMLDDYMNLP